MQTAPKRKLGVLIIDDDKNILKILAKVLQKQGHAVNAAETGREALRRLETQQYDVALIDVRLQDMSGLDLLSQIQMLAPNMVKIVLTGYPSDEDRTIALERGADEYLAKPIKSEKLIEIIESKQEQNRRRPEADCCETPLKPAYEIEDRVMQDDWEELSKK